jgi:hypothetical protein
MTNDERALAKAEKILHDTNALNYQHLRHITKAGIKQLSDAVKNKQVKRAEQLVKALKKLIKHDTGIIL